MRLFQKVALACLMAVGAPVVLSALPSHIFHGKPHQISQKSVGAYIWHDTTGLHIRFASNKGAARYHGKVCSSDRVVRVDPITLSVEESTTLGPRQHCVDFSTKVTGGLDGYDFNTSALAMSVHIWSNGRLLRKDNIWIGAKGIHPAGNPVIYRAPRNRAK